jgi:hypothetical protein
MVREQADVWVYVDRTAPPGGSGNPIGQCLFCPKTATQNAAAWWPHLAACKGSDTLSESQKKSLAEAKAKAKAQLESATVKARNQKAQKSAAAAAAAQEDAEGGGAASTAIGRAFANTRGQHADAAIARCIFANGLPLRLADDRFFREMISAVQATKSSYVPPHRQKLSAKDGLLQAEVKSLKRKQEHLIEQDKEKYGLTIVSDGFTDAVRRPLLNVVLVSPKGEYFMEAIDTSGDKKTMPYIAEKVRAERQISAIEQCCK